MLGILVQVSVLFWGLSHERQYLLWKFYEVLKSVVLEIVVGLSRMVVICPEVFKSLVTGVAVLGVSDT